MRAKKFVLSFLAPYSKFHFSRGFGWVGGLVPREAIYPSLPPLPVAKQLPSLVKILRVQL